MVTTDSRDLVSRWLDARRELAEAERAEHPNVTDTSGRVWTWKAGDLYRHEGKAWPLAFIDIAK